MQKNAGKKTVGKSIAMTNNNSTPNIIDIIISLQDTFTPRQLAIAKYLVDNYRKAAFMTATELAERVGVSQPTVIRFARFLGFERYQEFLKVFQDMLKSELTSTDRFSLSLEKKPNPEKKLDIVFEEIRTLNRMAENFPHETFEKCLDLICRSNFICIVGTRGSAFLAQHLAYFLNKVKRHVFSVTQGGNQAYDRLLELGQNDLLICLAFPRYPRETVELADFSKKRKIPVVGITDNPRSPIFPIADIAIDIPITFSTIFDSYCSVLCLFNLMVTRIGTINRPESEALLHDYEKTAKENNFFFKPQSEQGVKKPVE